MHRFVVGLMTAVVAGLVAAAPSEATVTPGIASVISPADGREVDVAYNADGDELVMIWVAQVGGGGDAIWAQRFTGAGEPVGVAKNVVSTGAAVRSPSIEFVPQHNEYYLAWIAYDDTNSTVEGKRVTDSLSDLGGPFSVAGGEHAGSVDLAQRWAGNMWFIYDAAPGTGGLAAGEYEVFRKIYSPSRTLVDDQLRISEAGSDGDAAVDTTGPAVAWGDVDHMSYLIAWEQQGAIHGQVHHEVNGAPGVDRDDFAISLHDGASDPAIAYSKERHEWLVVYAAGGHVYGRVVSNVAPWDLVGGEIDLSAHADATAQDPSVAWNATGAEWMATWSGTSAIAPGEREVYAQHLGAGHTVVHDDDPLIRM
ncbi:MAG TPA: hypothetical protein VNT55_04175, partial [Baekduia sp.]|nr:hypothetical protein [Baekduia sp.]